MGGEYFTNITFPLVTEKWIFHEDGRITYRSSYDGPIPQNQFPVLLKDEKKLIHEDGNSSPLLPPGTPVSPSGLAYISVKIHQVHMKQLEQQGGATIFYCFKKLNICLATSFEYLIYNKLIESGRQIENETDMDGEEEIQF